MASSSKSRPPSTSTNGSLMQDVPGAFPNPLPPPQSTPEDEQEDGQEPMPRSLQQIVYARRTEYVRAKNVRIKVGTWNVAAFKGAEKDVGGWFVDGKGVSERLAGLDMEDHDEREGVAEQEERYQLKKSTIPQGDEGTLSGGADVGLYVLGLQEVVDINSATEALRPYTDPAVAAKWKDAMNTALPTGYRLVAEQQLIGMLLLVFAAPDIANDVKSVSTTSVGTGLMGYFGNKGAVTARLVLGETTRLVFINSHLAAGADKAALDRRNWDAQQVLMRTKFEPIQDAMDLAQTTGEQIGDEDFAFWFGDLNYRLEGIPGDDVRRLLTLHTRSEYDLSHESARKVDEVLEEATNSVKQRVGEENSSGTLPLTANNDGQHSLENDRPTTLVDAIEASEDPTSLQTTLSSLLPHDELQQQMRARKAFENGWQEGPITFLPTYKYDAGSVGVFDSSEKKRAPSWCDRILYRTRRDKLAYDNAIREEVNARKKDEEFKAHGIDQGANDEEILYDYDPETDGADVNEEYHEYDEYDDTEDGVVITKEGFEDSIHLEYYTAHQRVLSSDHKPLVACFLLQYDAVVPELKTKIHAEVARELDKAENEGRPNVTVVVDEHNSTPAANGDSPDGKFEGVWFGDVRWAQSKHRSLTIANTSRVPASFSFIQRPVAAGQKPGLSPKWLTLRMNDHVVDSGKEKSEAIALEPGETCSVDLDVRILSMDIVKGLNDNRQRLEDILVLRVESGRDHFIPVRGNWLESSLGRSIDRLVRIPEGGIRKLQRQNPEGKVKAAAVMATATDALKEGTNKKDDDEDDLPVRFSAPRELFRLTEAVDELSTRIIAEWEMMNGTMTTGFPRASIESVPEPIAPWDEHPGWPFDEACWTERNTSHWDTALSEACNALDEDQPLEPSLPPDLPRMQRLYVLCKLLLLFLESIPDGVISEPLWTEIEKYTTTVEKSKKKPTPEDQKTALQELLVQSPSHNISFLLIVGMLEHIVQERFSSTSAPFPGGLHSRSASNASTATFSSSSAASTFTDVPLSPTKRASTTLMRILPGGGGAATRLPSPLPISKRKAQTTRALSKIFAGPAIRTSASGNSTSEKGKNLLEKRKVEFLEGFL